MRTINSLKSEISSIIEDGLVSSQKYDIATEYLLQLREEVKQSHSLEKLLRLKNEAVVFLRNSSEGLEKLWHVACEDGSFLIYGKHIWLSVDSYLEVMTSPRDNGADTIVIFLRDVMETLGARYKVCNAFGRNYAFMPETDFEILVESALSCYGQSREDILRVMEKCPVEAVRSFIRANEEGTTIEALYSTHENWNQPIETLHYMIETNCGISLCKECRRIFPHSDYVVRSDTAARCPHCGQPYHIEALFA